MTRDEARQVVVEVKNTPAVRFVAVGTDGGRWRVCVNVTATDTSTWVYSVNQWREFARALAYTGTPGFAVGDIVRPADYRTEPCHRTLRYRVESLNAAANWASFRRVRKDGQPDRRQGGFSGSATGYVREQAAP